MNVIDIDQGSDKWLELRKTHLTASDAAAMMGDSKYKSRKQLLHEKKTGKIEEVSPAKQNIFDRGHAAEESARTILEMENLEEFPPKVCTLEFEGGLSLLASLDGISENYGVIFEHKLWNGTLAGNVSNEVLEPTYYWQLEHQLLVTGADHVIFVVSDGTENNWIEMIYKSVPESREKLIAGWKQFVADLADYEPEAKQEAVVGEEAETFPLITYQIEGSAIVSNISQVLPIIKDRAAAEMARVLDTDQDFADKDKLNKATKAAREQLKERVAAAKGDFVSFKEFSDVAAQIDEVLQKMQSHGERQVKQAKEAKKEEIRLKADADLMNHIKECNEKINPLRIDTGIMSICPDFTGAMKNKRTLESLRNACESVVANLKIEINQVMQSVELNQLFLREHATDYSFLFADVQRIISQEPEPFQAMVKQRIADHKKEEERKLEADRERIRQEEKEKLEREEEEERLRIEKENAEPEVAEVQEEVIPERWTDAEIEAATAEHHEPIELEKPKILKPATFIDDYSAWIKDFNISQPAAEALTAILDKHSM